VLTTERMGRLRRHYLCRVETFLSSLSSWPMMGRWMPL